MTNLFKKLILIILCLQLSTSALLAQDLNLDKQKILARINDNLAILDVTGNDGVTSFDAAILGKILLGLEVKDKDFKEAGRKEKVLSWLANGLYDFNNDGKTNFRDLSIIPRVGVGFKGEEIIGTVYDKATTAKEIEDYITLAFLALDINENGRLDGMEGSNLMRLIQGIDLGMEDKVREANVYKWFANGFYDIDNNGVTNQNDLSLIGRKVVRLSGDKLIDGILTERTTAEQFTYHLDYYSGAGFYDINKDGTTNVADDGFLIVRYVVGARGEELIEGITTDKTQIPILEANLQYAIDIGAIDVNNDGQNTYNDTQIILKHMFGFTGDALLPEAKDVVFDKNGDGTITKEERDEAYKELGIKAEPTTEEVDPREFNFDGDADVDSNDFFLLDLILQGGSTSNLDNFKGASPLTADEILTNINSSYFKGLLDFDGDKQITNIDGAIGVNYKLGAAIADLEPGAIKNKITQEHKPFFSYFATRTGAEIRVLLSELLKDPGFDVDGDLDIDANDSFLIDLVLKGGDDNAITNFKGDSSLSAEEIRANINNLYFDNKLDIDGDQRITNIDGLAINLFQLGANDSQLEHNEIIKTIPGNKQKVFVYEAYRTGEQLQSYLLEQLKSLDYDVNQDGVVSYIDGALITIVVTDADDATINQRKGSSVLSPNEIRANVRQLYFDGKLDLDGDHQVDTRDALAMTLSSFKVAPANLERAAMDSKLSENSIGIIKYKPSRTGQEIKDHLDKLLAQTSENKSTEASEKITKTFERDSDGSITNAEVVKSLLEFNEAISGNPSADIIAKYDFNGDGKVNLGDLGPLNVALNNELKGHTQSFKAVFAIDTDQNGIITNQEAVSGLLDFFKATQAGASADLITRFDFDANGKVNLGELGPLNIVLGEANYPYVGKVVITTDIDGDENITLEEIARTYLGTINATDDFLNPHDPATEGKYNFNDSKFIDGADFAIFRDTLGYLDVYKKASKVINTTDIDGNSEISLAEIAQTYLGIIAATDDFLNPHDPTTEGKYNFDNSKFIDGADFAIFRDTLGYLPFYAAGVASALAQAKQDPVDKSQSNPTKDEKQDPVDNTKPDPIKDEKQGPADDKKSPEDKESTPVEEKKAPDNKKTPGKEIPPIDKRIPNIEKSKATRSSPVLENPTKRDRVLLEELIKARKEGKAVANQANTNQSIIETIIDRIDSDGNGILEKQNLIDSYTATLKATITQDLRYDFNDDGVVDDKDSRIMRNLYNQQVPGLRGDFKLVK